MKEKLAYDLAGESTTRVMALDGTTAEDVINKRNTEKFNEQVDKWTEKFEEHSSNICGGLMLSFTAIGKK